MKSDICGAINPKAISQDNIINNKNFTVMAKETKKSTKSSKVKGRAFTVTAREWSEEELKARFEQLGF